MKLLRLKLSAPGRSFQFGYINFDHVRAIQVDDDGYDRQSRKCWLIFTNGDKQRLEEDIEDVIELLDAFNSAPAIS